MRTWKKLAGVGLIGVAILAGALALDGCRAFGGSVEGPRRARAEASPQWRDGAFRNALPRAFGGLWPMLEARLAAEHTTPNTPVAVAARSAADFRAPPASGLRVTWFGHSSFLVELDGAKILVDPVWGERASPFSFVGPKRFYAPPLPLAELPPVDVVVISHDHYDHLDMPTVDALRAFVPRWVVPLGVGAHLEAWGVAPSRVRELDWWDSLEVAGVKLTCTPARHFSGRGLEQDSTLWAGWALTGPEHRVFYSGDTALHPELEAIGERLGPFDLTLIETGAYSPLWSDVHLGPEQAVLAHLLVGGQTLLPVHWGLFDLANHSWTEPVQRVRAAAAEAGVVLALPRPGGQVEPSGESFVDPWWDETIPWRTLEERPAYSSRVDALIARARAMSSTVGSARPPPGR